MSRQELAEQAERNAELAYQKLVAAGYAVEMKQYDDDGMEVAGQPIGARTYVIVNIDGTLYSTQYHERLPDGAGFNNRSGKDVSSDVWRAQSQVLEQVVAR